MSLDDFNLTYRLLTETLVSVDCKYCKAVSYRLHLFEDADAVGVSHIPTEFDVNMTCLFCFNFTKLWSYCSFIFCMSSFYPTVIMKTPDILFVYLHFHCICPNAIAIVTKTLVSYRDFLKSPR